MNKYKQIFNVIFLLILCVSLNSCLSVDRKIKLNRDGSGEEVLTVTFMQEFYSLMSSMTSLMDSTRRDSFLDSLYSDEIFINKTKGKYDSIPGITVNEIYSKKNYDSSQSFIISYSFDSLSKIGSLLEKTVESDDEIKSPAVVTMINEGDLVKFNYIYEQTAEEPISDNDSLNAQMKAGIAEMFGSGFVNFEIEFPYEVVSSNATSANGNILTWNLPMTEVFMTSSMKLEATMK
ncbi:MAG: hypothetical protein IPL53_03220 [Ignavibacteria bacterium]|nr:hypothetical protein [Ignavibacteria bacterium]